MLARWMTVVLAACGTAGNAPFYEATLRGVPWWADQVHARYCRDCEDTPMVYATIGDPVDQPVIHFEIDAVRCFSGASWIDDLSRQAGIRVTYRSPGGEPVRAVSGEVWVLACSKYSLRLRFQAVFDKQLGHVEGEVDTAVD